MVPEQVGQLQVPLLLIVGEDDQNWPAQESALDVSSCLRAEALHLLTAPHVWNNAGVGGACRWTDMLGPAAQACTLIHAGVMYRRMKGFHYVTFSFSFFFLDERNDGASWEQSPADHPVLSKRRSPDRTSVHAPLSLHRLQNSNGATEK